MADVTAHAAAMSNNTQSERPRDPPSRAGSPPEDTPLDPLEPYRIAALPASFYYVRDFLSAADEAALLEHIDCPRAPWVHLRARKLQVYPARLTAANVLLAPPSAAALPPWLARPTAAALARLGVFAQTAHGAANHCLVNAYAAGQGILAHEDGPAYAAAVATVTLGAHGVLEVRGKAPAGGGAWRVLQEPRSLLVTRGPAYAELLHGIAEAAADEGLDGDGVANWALLAPETRARLEAQGGRWERETRVSLTFRDVLKVSTLGGKLFGRK